MGSQQKQITRYLFRVASRHSLRRRRPNFLLKEGPLSGGLDDCCGSCWDFADRPKAMGWTPPHLNGIEVPDWECHQPVAREKGLP